MALENLSPAVVASLARQIKALATAAPDGVTLVPGETFSEVVADITGPAQTPYEGGIFRVKLILGKDYPAGPPKGYFLTKIFHPNVSDKGDICVNTLKKDWTPDTTLSHVLAVIRCLLIVPFPESSLNDEAGKLFMESYDEYARKARLVTNVHAMKAPSSSSAAAAGAGAEEERGSAAADSSAAAAPSSSSSSSSSLSSGAEPLTTGGKANILPASVSAGGKAAAVAGGAGATKPSAAAAEKKKSMKRL